MVLFMWLCFSFLSLVKFTYLHVSEIGRTTAKGSHRNVFLNRERPGIKKIDLVSFTLFFSHLYSMFLCAHDYFWQLITGIVMFIF